MLKLYKNKKNTFECRVEIEGSSYENAKPRLILMPTNDNRNLFFEGVIDKNTCKVVVTPNLDIPKTGKVMLEVVVDNATVFTPWQTEYEIIVEQAKVQSESVKMTVEPNKSSVKIVEGVTIQKEPIPKVKVIESKPIKKGVFLENISTSNKAIVNEILGAFHALKKKEKKALVEHISKDYKPADTTVKWAKSIFNNQNSLATKLAMYCFELEEKKKK